jgi:hypothetical protein
VIDRSYRLEDIVDATRYVETPQDRQRRPAGQRRPQDLSRSQPEGEWRRRELNPRKISIGLNGRRSAREL